MWFLIRMTFIVDNMFAKYQVSSDEFESVAVTVCGREFKPRISRGVFFYPIIILLRFPLAVVVVLILA